MGLELPPPLLDMGMNNAHQQGNSAGKGSSNNSGTGQQSNGQGQDSSSESEDWGEESWIVDCPCGVTFDDGEEMVECDECGVWVHTSCCQVSKSVAQYVCDKCKDKEKKRKEKEESEVAQLLIELPAKAVNFDDKNYEKSDVFVQALPIEHRVHEHGLPGGDPAMFEGVSKVFSQQLWKSSGYVPKLLQVEYKEIPHWDCEFSSEHQCLFEFPQNDSLKGIQRNEMLKIECNNNSGNGELLRFRSPAQEKVTPSRKLESLRQSKHRDKLRGIKDEKKHKRIRDDTKEQQQFSRKKSKNNQENFRGDHRKGQYFSPKNPKAMKKNAVQEFMDGDTAICSRCLKAESVDEGARPSVCHDCEKLRSSIRHGKKQVDRHTSIFFEGKADKHDRSVLNFLAETASNALSDPSKLFSDHQNDTSSLGEQFGHHKVKEEQISDIRTGNLAKADLPSPASINSAGAGAGTGGNSSVCRTNTGKVDSTSSKFGAASPPNQRLKNCAIFSSPRPFGVLVPSANKSVAMKVTPGHMPKATTTSMTKPLPTKAASSSVPLKKTDNIKSPEHISSLQKDILKPPSTKNLSTTTTTTATTTKTLQPTLVKQQFPNCKTSLSHQISVSDKKYFSSPLSTSNPTTAAATTITTAAAAAVAAIKSHSAGRSDADASKDDKFQLKAGSAAIPQLNSVATTCINDKEFALLVHQELNSSPRVPRASRRQQVTTTTTPCSQAPHSSLSAKQRPSEITNNNNNKNGLWRTRYREEQMKEAKTEDCSRYGETPLVTALNRKHEEIIKSDDDDDDDDDDDGDDEATSSDDDDDGGGNDDSADTCDDVGHKQTTVDSCIVSSRSSPLSDVGDERRNGDGDDDDGDGDCDGDGGNVLTVPGVE